MLLPLTCDFVLHSSDHIC